MIDASLFVEWLLNERQDQESRDFWQALSTQKALVPAHWPNEVANALRRAVRTKRLPIADVEPTARELMTLDIELAQPPRTADIARLVTDALQYELSVYDLQYLHLAQKFQVPLATRDQAMSRAAIRMDIALFGDVA